MDRSRASTRAWLRSFLVVQPQRYAIHTALGLIHVIRSADHIPASRGPRKLFAATAGIRDRIVIRLVDADGPAVVDSTDLSNLVHVQWH